MLLATPVVAGDWEDVEAARKAGDYQKEFRLWKRLAEQGNKWAQFSVGEMYEYGEGVPEDDAKAAYWYRKAAEQGYAEAQHFLGNMYRRGKGVPRDDAKAVHWLRKAAEQGDVDSQYNLHQHYFEGEGVAKSYAKAAHWYCKAVEQGHKNATSGQCNDLKLSADFEEAEAAYEAANYRKSFEIWEQLAKQDWMLQGDAQYQLGKMYAKGQGVHQSDMKAYAWWATAVEIGAAADAENWVSKATEAKDKLATYMSERDFAEARKLAGV
jgi:TPR repeat protein